MSIKAIIIDDEINAVKSLQLLLGSMDMEVEVLGFASNVIDGLKLIKTQQPDLVFLDINMPQYTGFDLLDTVDTKNFKVVFTTAHEEYAIQSIKHQAFDYLLKPIDSEELSACLWRFKKESDENPSATNYKLIKVAVNNGILFLKQEEVIRIEGSGSYSDIYMSGGQKHTISKHLKAIEDLLDPSLFFRCHNSYIINLNRVRKFISTEGPCVEMEDESVVWVSRSKKDGLLKRLA